MPEQASQYPFLGHIKEMVILATLLSKEERFSDKYFGQEKEN